jgi:hypothetical protein
MKTVVHEPQTEYKVSGWLPSPGIFPIDEYILNIENNLITFCPPSSSVVQLSLNESKVKKLSFLRGKMTKQNEKEIDDQISRLREEWERNI